MSRWRSQKLYIILKFTKMHTRTLPPWDDLGFTQKKQFCKYIPIPTERFWWSSFDTAPHVPGIPQGYMEHMSPKVPLWRLRYTVSHNKTRNPCYNWLIIRNNHTHSHQFKTNCVRLPQIQLFPFAEASQTPQFVALLQEPFHLHRKILSLKFSPQCHAEY